MIGDQTYAEALRIAERHLIKLGWKFTPTKVAEEANKIVSVLRASKERAGEEE